jgi:DNA (cytosine-5)-methyltransferase 1
VDCQESRYTQFSNILKGVFDGVIKSGDKEEALYHIPFEKLSIGNLFTPSQHNISNQIWIQSRCGASCPVAGGVWYELGTPAKEYGEYWEAFHWIALLAKYVSDALEVCVERKEKVTLKYFQRDFAAEMRQLHGGDPVFDGWMAAYGKGMHSNYTI